MKFEEIVAAPETLRTTAGKKEKVRIISELLGRSRGRETYLLAHYLVGSIPAATLGIGWKTIQNAMEGLTPSDQSSRNRGGAGNSGGTFQNERSRVHTRQFREDKQAGEADTIQTVWSTFEASSGRQQKAGM